MKTSIFIVVALVLSCTREESISEAAYSVFRTASARLDELAESGAPEEALKAWRSNEQAAYSGYIEAVAREFGGRLTRSVRAY